MKVLSILVVSTLLICGTSRPVEEDKNDDGDTRDIYRNEGSRWSSEGDGEVRSYWGRKYKSEKGAELWDNEGQEDWPRKEDHPRRGRPVVEGEREEEDEEGEERKSRVRGRTRERGREGFKSRGYGTGGPLLEESAAGSVVITDQSREGDRFRVAVPVHPPAYDRSPLLCRGFSSPTRRRPYAEVKADVSSLPVEKELEETKKEIKLRTKPFLGPPLSTTDDDLTLDKIFSTKLKHKMWRDKQKDEAEMRKKGPMDLVYLGGTRPGDPLCFAESEMRLRPYDTVYVRAKDFRAKRLERPGNDPVSLFTVLGKDPEAAHYSPARRPL